MEDSIIVNGMEVVPLKTYRKLEKRFLALQDTAEFLLKKMVDIEVSENPSVYMRIDKSKLKIPNG